MYFFCFSVCLFVSKFVSCLLYPQTKFNYDHFLLNYDTTTRLELVQFCLNKKLHLLLFWFFQIPFYTSSYFSLRFLSLSVFVSFSPKFLLLLMLFLQKPKLSFNLFPHEKKEIKNEEKVYKYRYISLCLLILLKSLTDEMAAIGSAKPLYS